jgi:hypothetical protein
MPGENLSSRERWAIGVNFCGWAAVVVGPCLLIAGVVSYLDARKFVETATRTEGIVEPAGKSDAVIVFKDAAGAEHRLEVGAAGSPAGFEAGRKVPILYDPANPGRAKIDFPLSIWGRCAVFLGFGVIDCFLGVALLIVARLLNVPLVAERHQCQPFLDPSQPRAAVPPKDAPPSGPEPE